MFGLSRANNDVKSLEAAQELLSALETLKGRLNTAFKDRVIDTGYYQSVRADTHSIEQTLRTFALHHERSYNRSVGFVERMQQQQPKGMLSK
ncbi:hypothetical protein [Paenibacillus durus]|uniref:Uncharacterized protein n=1 Tax=Paenibacillus durus TaxID=44251 RepID=A0A089HTA5_PAEDU|nr:hypothetical protein [Paenibacillus durus]AIQ15271.1 hypothetical protein PDUR_27995 [Paenibacillus durus]